MRCSVEVQILVVRLYAFILVGPDASGARYIIDARSSKPLGFGFLNDFVTPGNVGSPMGTDNPNAGTWFDSGSSDAVCDAVNAMIGAAADWPDGTIPYSWSGPNSNTFANFIGQAGGFNVSQPPGGIGWNTPLPSGTK